MTDCDAGPTKGERIGRAAGRGAVALLCLLPPLLALAYIQAFGVDCVFMDSLHFPGYVEKWQQGTLTFQELNSQHNEHRFLFPRLVMLPLALATHYDTVTEMYVGWGFLCLSAVPVFLLCRRLYADGWTAAAAFVPAAWVLFSLRQSLNLLWGWQLTFFMANAFLLLSMYCLERARRLDGWLLAAAATGVVASFSFSSMLLIWPVGVVLLALKRPWQEAATRTASGLALLAWAAAGILVWVAYFTDYHKPGHHPSLAYGLHHPWEALRFLCLYLSNPLGLSRDMRVAGGAALLVLYAGAAVVAFRRWRAGAPLPGMPLGMILFVLGAGLITTVARAGFGPDQALAAHYQTFTGLGLVGLYLSILSLRPEARLALSLRPTAQGVARTFEVAPLLGLALLVALVVRPMYVKAAGQGEDTVRVRTLYAHYLRTAPLQSDRILQELYPDARVVRDVADRLRRLKLSVGSRPAPALPPELQPADERELPAVIDLFMGQPVSSETRTVSITRETDSLSVAGHAQDRAARAAAGAVFIEIDGQQNIPAAYGIPRRDVARAFHCDAYRRSGFIFDFALALLSDGRHTLRVKVVSADGKRCAVAAQPLILEIRPAGPK